MKSMFQMIATLACVLGLTACGGGDDKTAASDTPQPAYAKTDLVTGTGETAANGDLVTILYKGYLYDSANKENGRGAQFEASAPGAGVSFAVATGVASIKGWDLGVIDMKVGGKANLVLPSNLAFGAAGYTSSTGVKVAANAPVVFEVELIAVKKASLSPTVTIVKEAEVAGTGAEAVLSKTLTVHYTGYFHDASSAGPKGAKFESSHDTGKAFDFVIGAGTVIMGWDRGVMGMKVGGKRTLIIPPELAYGPAGRKDAAGVVVIPANATLVFDIELIAVK